MLWRWIFFLVRSSIKRILKLERIYQYHQIQGMVGNAEFWEIEGKLRKEFLRVQFYFKLILDKYEGNLDIVVKMIHSCTERYRNDNEYDAYIHPMRAKMFSEFVFKAQKKMRKKIRAVTKG